ncbi:MAG: helix-turn-helix transcriptional regulator [Bacteroidales bacterium]|nr:helix-turn-helix transcriptional regulator [Alloprevotella sp.]MBR1644051.1 helix-turn-helix transcriptional regulator [Bacteroidales bacterium]
MNRYETTKELLRGIKLNNFDCERLAAVEASVLRLMADGTPTVEMVAGSMGMHLSKFRRRVKSITGIAAADYITFVRMSHALEMLGDHPRYSVSQVAERCGYADAAHFSHAFRRWFDCSPLQYVETALAVTTQ